MYAIIEEGGKQFKVTSGDTIQVDRAPDRVFPPDDHRSKHKFFTVENRKRVMSGLEKIKPIAAKHQASYAQTVINWTIHEHGITAAIVGARNAEQARHNAGALNFTLSDDE